MYVCIANNNKKYSNMKCLPSLVCLFIIQFGFAQSVSTKMTGVIIDSLSKQPLPYASVAVENGNSRQNTSSNIDGTYFFKKILPGNYKIIISYTGYKPKSIAITVPDNNETVIVPSIKLSLENFTLAEISVKAMKPFIQQEIDKIVLNISESIMANSGSSLDVLKRSPSVQVNENDGTMTLRGKKVMIYIDGKLSQLSAESLEGFLSSMPSNSIDKIELISNPSVKYEASGMAVINIRTLKMKNLGTTGIFNVGVNWGKYISGNSGLLLNYRNNKLSFIGSYSSTLNQNYTKVFSYRALGENKYFGDEEYYKRRRQLQFYKAILDYDLTKKTTVGFIFQGDNNQRSGFMNAKTSIGKSPIIIDSLITVDSKSNTVLTNWNINFNTKHQIKANQTISLDVDYASFKSSWGDIFNQKFLSQPLATTYKPDSEIWLPWNQKTTVKSIKSDYTFPAKIGNWEMGIQIRSTKMDMDFTYQEKKDNSWIQNNQKSFNYDYAENVNAAYINFNGKKDKLIYQAGLRAEQTNILINNLDTQLNNKQNYQNLFPNVALQYAISKNQKLSVSYTQRITRPSYNQLNERPSYFNPYRQTYGNAYLKPILTNSFETRLNINQSWLITLGYQLNKNDISLIPTVVENATRYKSYNFKYAELYSFDIVYNANLKSWWNTNTGFQYFYNNNNFQNLPEVSDIRKSSFYFRSNNYFSLKNGLKLELTGYYYPPQMFGIFDNFSIKKIDFGIQKSILNKKGDLRLNITDAFNLYTLRYLFKTNTINGDENIKTETRFIKLSFIYKFGNTNVKTKERKLGIERETNRIDK